jgi:hypothetical protein
MSIGMLLFSLEAGFLSIIVGEVRSITCGNGTGAGLCIVGCPADEKDGWMRRCSEEELFPFPPCCRQSIGCHPAGIVDLNGGERGRGGLWFEDE